MPWLAKHNPSIDWKLGTVSVAGQHLIRSAAALTPPSPSLTANLISGSQLDSALKRNEVEKAALCTSHRLFHQQPIRHTQHYLCPISPTPLPPIRLFSLKQQPC
jgi:hypothetical protein